MKGEHVLRIISTIAILVPVLFLLYLLGETLVSAWPRLDSAFLSNFPSRNPEEAGFLAALAGSFWLMILTTLISVPLGIGAALYLEEYAKEGRWMSFIEINIANLSGVPSIIYGLLGLELFVRVMQLERSLISGALTLSLLLLPLIIVAAREALRAIPYALREAVVALGAYPLSSIRYVVLPLGLPGMLTGVILSLSRAIGETAPLIMIGALTYVAFLPDSLGSPFTAMPIQIFNWISRPQEAFHAAAAAGIVVLISILLVLNATAIVVRARMRKNIEL